jgi:ATPase subunit of ABC transporter with duplicated ATPase domains
MAKLMLAMPNLLLLDEPTNNLDIPSCEALEEAIADFEGTVLAISHDRYFVERVAGREVRLVDGRINE